MLDGISSNLRDNTLYRKRTLFPWDYVNIDIFIQKRTYASNFLLLNYVTLDIFCILKVSTVTFFSFVLCLCWHFLFSILSYMTLSYLWSCLLWHFCFSLNCHSWHSHQKLGFSWFLEMSILTFSPKTRFFPDHLNFSLNCHCWHFPKKPDFPRFIKLLFSGNNFSWYSLLFWVSVPLYAPGIY